MAIEQMGLIKVGEKDATVVGPDIVVGQTAPDFSVQARDWSVVNGLDSTTGKERVIAAVPSLETAVCDRETRRFNVEAASLSEDIVILVLSTDLLYTQKWWCGAAGVDKVRVLSDRVSAEFGEKYGCLIKERRVLRGAVFVVDANDKVTYVDYMAAFGDEPHYDEVLAAARAALSA